MPGQARQTTGGIKAMQAMYTAHPPHTTTPTQFQDNKGVELPLIRHGEPGSLVLVDGSVHQGFGFGASVPIAGEVVFNTGTLIKGVIDESDAPLSSHCR